MDEERDRVARVLSRRQIREARWQDAVDALVDERAERYGERSAGYVCGLTAVSLLAAHLFTDEQIEEAIETLGRLRDVGLPEN